MNNINITLEETLLQRCNTVEELMHCEGRRVSVPAAVQEEDSPPGTIDFEDRLSTIEQPVNAQPVLATRQNAGLEGVEDLSIKVEALQIVNMFK